MELDTRGPTRRVAQASPQYTSSYAARLGLARRGPTGHRGRGG